MRVKWLRAALVDVDAVADFIARCDPAAADRVTDRIMRAVEQLAEHPAIGRAGRVKGTRELVVSGTPFIIPYRVREGAVEVLRVLHAARRWPTEF